jgi:membrane protein
LTVIRRVAADAGRLVWRAAGEFFADDCPQRAAAISYYALFSLFPVAILLVGILGLIVRDDHARDQVIGFVLDQLPLREHAGRDDLQRLLDEVTGSVGRFGLVGLFGLVFAASGVMGAVRAAFNAAWDVEDPRPPVQGKLIDIALVFALGSLIVLSLAVSVAGRFVVSLAASIDGTGVAGSIGAWLLNASPLTSTILAFLTFLALFRVVPATPTHLRDVWPGALLAAAGLEAAKQLFAVYLSTAANYNAIYASLGSVIAFSVFVFIAANIVLLGAEAAAHWPRLRDEQPEPGDTEPLRERLTSAAKSLFVRQR